ncbi:MAG: DUF3854 domain-containing protein [Cyanobacteriota bacterium]|jgi:hypothetical protein
MIAASMIGSGWDAAPAGPDALLPQHLAEWVDGSAVAPVLAAANVQSLQGWPVLEALAGDRLDQQRGHSGQYVTASVSRLLAPLEPLSEAGGWWCSGLDPCSDWASMEWGCFKPDKPRWDAEKAKPRKYEHPAGVPSRSWWLRVPGVVAQLTADRFGVALPAEVTADGDGGDGAFWRWWAQTPTLPLVVTEGAKKAGSLLSAGVPAVAAPGIWNPSARGELLPELAAVPLSGRPVWVLFDGSDKPKPREPQAALRLGGLLERAGADVLVGTCPPPHKGADDALATGVPWEVLAATLKPLGDAEFEASWALLEVEADRLEASDWELPKIISALTRKAKKLEVTLPPAGVADLLEAAARRRRTAGPVLPGESFTVTENPWVVDGIFRHGLNLVVGQPGAGKSRLAADLAHAWVRGDDSWLDRPLARGGHDRHILIVGPDQGHEDWAQTLAPVGLATRQGQEVTLHSKVTLYGMDSGTRLDAAGLRLIRRWADDHPGGLVIIDSLTACLPAGVDPDKATVRRPLQGLAEAIGSGWGLLLHHTRKASGRDRTLGVGAGSGSTQIDAACSRVVGLGLIHKTEHGVMVPQEADPRRELLSTKRGGASLHLVVSSDHTGKWTCEGSAEDLKRQERQERARENLSEAQTEALETLEAHGGWMTVRDIATTDGSDYDSRGGKAATLRKTLERLKTLGLIESERAGSEKTYRARQPLPRAHGGVRISSSPCSPLALEEISLAHPLAHQNSPGSPPGSPSTGGEPVSQWVSQGEPDGEPPKTLPLQRVSRMSRSESPPQRGSGGGGPVVPDPPPGTNTAWVELALSRLDLPASRRVVPEVIAWLKTCPGAPFITSSAVAHALSRLESHGVGDG